jgi:hypothetical protein
MKKITLIFLSLLSGYSLFSQNVAINTTGAVANSSAMLDVDATNMGILVPRVALTATTDVVTVAAPANSLLVYNSATAGAGATAVIPGYYYYSTAANAWIRLLNNGDAWLTTGNYMAANGVFGTLTNYSIILGTNNFARGAFMNTGELFLNPGLTFFNGDVFSSYGTGTQYALNAYFSGAGIGNAGYFQNTSTSVNSGTADFLIGGASWGIWTDIQSTTNTHPAVAGVTRTLTSTGVAGAVNSTSTITILVGGSGGAFISPTTGVYATASNATSSGALFSGNNVAAGAPATGAGSSSNGSSIGVYGAATTVASGTGGVFAGNGGGYSTLAGGSGIAATGTGVGIMGIGTTAGSGTGGAFGANNLAITTLVAGSGVSGIGNTVGIAGFVSGNNAGSMGGYFERNGGTFVARVCENNGGTDQKIRGTGAVSTIVRDLDNNEVTMFATEAPEVLFQDYGHGQLVNGTATISLDPIFTKNVTVNDQHPLRVFIQLEGDCKGVFVTNKTAAGFEVKELDGGTSNVAFTYTIVANRADRIENGILLSKFEDVRFLKGDDVKLDSKQEQVIKGEVIIHETQEIHKDAQIKERQQKLQ